MTKSTNVDHNSSDDSPGVVIMPPAVFLNCLVIGSILEWFLPPFRGAFTIAGLVAGLCLLAAGLAFMTWGHGRFKMLGVNVKTIQPASRLVTDGAYRLSRNPMYVGFVAMLAGLGIAVPSLWLCAMCMPFFAYFNWYVIPREEAYLMRRFGPVFTEYHKRTRRWI